MSVDRVDCLTNVQGRATSSCSQWAVDHVGPVCKQLQEAAFLCLREAPEDRPVTRVLIQELRDLAGTPPLPGVAHTSWA
jgi:hypothetical protein